MTETEKLPGPVVRCFLEIGGVPVDPAGPWYWVPDEQAHSQEPPDWSGWQNTGAVTDQIPPAFRRRRSPDVQLIMPQRNCAAIPRRAR
jgi:hypothetical protein